MKDTVLLTGAAGKIGAGFRDEYLEKYSRAYKLRLGVFKDLEDGRFGDVVELDITDYEGVLAALDGVDVILHLAANADWQASYDELEGPNLRGAYNVFQGAVEVGCRRVVFASSVHAIMGYPVDYQVHAHDPPRADSLYGVSKVYGEALCSAYAHMHGISCIAVRIGAYRSTDELRSLKDEDNPQLLDIMVTQRDLCQLLHKCITAPEHVKYAVVAGLSNNRYTRMQNNEACDLLGYEPQDDAFELGGVSLGEEEKV